MSNWQINSKSLQGNATYTDENFRIEVSYAKDAVTQTTRSINGDIYRVSTGENAGNYYGNATGDGAVSYSFNNVKMADMGNISTAVEAVEDYVENETMEGGEV